MSWTRRVAAALVATLAATTVAWGVPGPANAEGVAIADDAGDTTMAGLDFTEVVLRNRDHDVVAVTTFDRDRRGEIIVGVRIRGHGLVARAVSVHRLHGRDRLFLVTGDNEKTRCRGLHSSWDRKAAKMRLWIPSRCLLDGNYGAVRGWFLTEEFQGGSDVDHAPERPGGGPGATGWISRG